MPYTHFRYIAYEVPTAGGYKDRDGDAPAGAGYMPGVAPDEIPHAPVPDFVGLNPDAFIRLRRLAAAVDIARHRIVAEGGDNANTLKVFIAPEFYFRPPTYNADFYSETYPVKDFTYILQSITKMFRHGDFSNWLIVAGTVLWSNAKEVAGTKEKPIFRNTMIAIEGGDDKAKPIIIEKRAPSLLDGTPVNFSVTSDVAYQRYHNDPKLLKQNIFEVGGVICGAEICLDHLDKDGCRALRTLNDTWKGDRFPPRIALHLLPAGGMGINTGSTCARGGGYILRCDGFTRSSNTTISQSRQVDHYRLDGHTTKYATPRGNAVFNGHETPRIYSFTHASMALPPLGKAPNGNPYYTFDSGYALYPVRSLP